MSGAAPTNTNTLSWFVVVVAGTVVLLVVRVLSLFSRLDAGQSVLDGARPAFTEERVAGTVASIKMVDHIVNMADPIVDSEGGAAAEIGSLIELVSEVTGLSQVQVLGAMQEISPRTLHLLLALPLENASAEIPGLLDFVAENSDLADRDAVLSAVSENTPNIAQAVVNLGVVTDNWRDVAGTEALTRFDGSNVTGFPEVRSYLADDVVPAVRAVAEDYRELDETAPPVGVFPSLLTIVGILVLAYGAAMVAITRTAAPTYTSTGPSETPAEAMPNRIPSPSSSLPSPNGHERNI